MPEPDAPDRPLRGPDTPVRGPARPGPYVVVGVLLAISIALPLIVSIYARTDPTVGGLPFFYWYQLLWVFIDSGLLAIAYVVLTREDRRRRAVARATAEKGQNR
jgi:hypothetical protein